MTLSYGFLKGYGVIAVNNSVKGFILFVINTTKSAKEWFLILLTLKLHCQSTKDKGRIEEHFLFALSSV